jgi:hypothetical protein
MPVNELRCDGVRLVFRTRQESLDKAVSELEWFMAKFNIDVELSGMMRLCDGAGNTLEVC